MLEISPASHLTTFTGTTLNVPSANQLFESRSSASICVVPNIRSLSTSPIPESKSKNCCPFKVILNFPGIEIYSGNADIVKFSEHFWRRIVRLIESNLDNLDIVESVTVSNPVANIDLVLSIEFIARCFIVFKPLIIFTLVNISHVSGFYDIPILSY